MEEVKYILQSGLSKIEVYENSLLFNQKTIMLDAITQLKLTEPGFVQNGELIFKFGSGLFDIGSIKFPEKDLETAKEIKKHIETYKKRLLSNTQTNQISVADEIRKLKILVDEGVLTQEEFEAKKKQLLNS